MKIIAAKCEIPGLNILGNKAPVENGYESIKYSFPQEVQIPHWAVGVCKKLLNENNIEVDEIGVIVGNSIAVTGTTENTNSAAPGVCHTIQKELAIKNAFVFDLFHTDWCTALEVANMFLVQESYKYGLIVKAEKFESFDNELKFALPDGVSIILFERDYTGENPVQYFHAKNENTQAAASLHFISNIDINNADIRFKIKWDANAELGATFDKQMRLFIDESKENNSVDTTIVERWFLPVKLAELNKKKPENDDVYLGMHSLPWEIQKMKDSKNTNQKIQAIAFNPFLLQYSSLTFNI